MKPGLIISLSASLSCASFAVEVGSLRVTQLANNNNIIDSANPGVSIVKAPGSTAGGNFLGTSNRGDYTMDFGRGRDMENGILLSSIAQLTRNDSATGGPAPGEFFATSSFGFEEDTGKYWIAIHAALHGDNIEANHDVSYAYLPYDIYPGGFATNDVNNGPLTRFIGTQGLQLGVNLTDPAETNGQYHLDLAPMVANASQSGVLLVTGAKNEDNFALSRANADGSFHIFCHDNAANGSSYENDGVGFAYLPAASVGAGRLVALGRVNGDATTDVASGNFTVTKGSTGRWYLSIPGHTADSGTLIVSPEGGVNYNVDNIVSAGWDAGNQRWIIESRDLGAAPQVPDLQDMQTPTDDVFSFAFFSATVANSAPTIAASTPADEAIKVAPDSSLTTTVADADGEPLTVTYHARRVSAVDPTGSFSVVALPDTQFYSENTGGQRAALFSAQTDWIVAEKDARNIGFVLHLGDITQHGDRPDTALEQWTNASNAMYRLENPATTGSPDGVPYILAVGNHDQTPIGDADGTTTNFNTYFGVHPETGINHFADKSWYGGTSVPHSADNNYTLFTAGGIDFIVISLEFDLTPDEADLEWADALLKAHPARRGIVITHHMVNTGNPARFSVLGAAIYEALKDNPNLILMHGGHIAGEGRRTDTFEGRAVHSLLADYQSRSNGGDAWLRIMKFIPALNRVEVSTYSPVLDVFETDEDSQFSLDVNLKGGMGPFTPIGSVTVQPGTASLALPDLEPGTRYEWYATVSDGTTTASTPVRSFITSGVPFPPTVEVTSPANGSTMEEPGSFTFEASASDIDGSITKVEYFSGTTKLGEATTAPYSFTWQDVPAGSHTILAKATDDEGNTSFSAPVAVQVIAQPVVPDVSTVSTGRFNAGWTLIAGSPAPLAFTSPGSNVGDLVLRVNGSPVKFLSNAIITANWENAGNSGVDSIDNVALPYSDGSGNAWVNVSDNSNPNAADANPTLTEESAGTAVACLPYAAGWTGASITADGALLGGNLPAGTTVRRVGDGLYTISGLPTTGNLLAFPNGNGGTDGDNVLSVRKDGSQWIVDVRDNSSDSQNGSFSFLHIPADTPGVLSGMIRANGNLVPLNGRLSDMGATVTKTNDYFEITFGDGTEIRSASAAIFLTGDSTSSGAAGDNIHSYSSSGNSFRIFSQDLPQLDGTFQAVDLRFLVVPFNLAPFKPVTTAVSVTASDAEGHEFGGDTGIAFTVTRSGAADAPLTVHYATSGSATDGADYTSLPGTIEIPAGQLTATINTDVLVDDVVEGTENIIVTLLPNAAYTLGEPGNATATIHDRPLQSYLHDKGLSSPDGDDDGDGISNLLEYFHGTHNAAAANLGSLRAVAAGDAGGTFTASFPRSKSATDVTANVEWSTDLQTWHRSGESNGTQTADIALRVVSAAEEDPETVEATLTISEGPVPASIYLRLVVTP
ncbi:Ig-like domain-containing protein [Luteolibacter flavescens]|uniref:Ig-like domain-containing protein n=1 Tax=Luteolibacter flavescens TaxID=1859460 RepID=A0ABT3FWH3_9BACT|nr:Ig-like domain-containing protein [Luteolibacter flavescens]MCW1887569.1 Ig-like domain-containing protein [Luteolibacter flavescens]